MDAPPEYRRPEPAGHTMVLFGEGKEGSDRVCGRPVLPAIRWVALITGLVSVGVSGVLGGYEGYAGDSRVFFVAPEVRGEGSGETPSEAAGWTDENLWDVVEAALENGDVVVNLLEGSYYVSSQDELEMPRLTLSGLGHEENRLIVQGESPEGVTITRYPEDGTGSGDEVGLIRVRRCRNLTLRNLHFTAPGGHRIGYAVLVERSRDILFDSCSWVDMPNVHYGATGAHREETFNIVYSNCRFVRVGRRGGAHMAYNAYAPRAISYINCYFEDCAGDYVRFRSASDFGVVAGCTFRSTGEHINTHMPFISIPLFNNVDPGDEVFGTHFLIFNNRFLFETEADPDDRIAIRFLHRGFDPPGRRHLLDPREAEILESGTLREKRALLRENLRINPASVHVYGNRYKNVEHKGVYQFDAAYGAESRGGDGRYDIFDTFNSRPRVGAAEYWKAFESVLGPRAD